MHSINMPRCIGYVQELPNQRERDRSRTTGSKGQALAQRFTWTSNRGKNSFPHLSGTEYLDFVVLMHH